MRHLQKLIVAIFVLLLTAGMLAACGSNNGNDEKKDGEQGTEQQTGGDFPVTVNDATGEKITIEKEPERIVSLVPNTTEIVFAIGLGEKIVGRSQWDNYPEEVLKIESIGDMNFNVEKVLSLNPDLVLGIASQAESTPEGLQQLKDAGLKVVLVQDAKSFEQVYNNIALIGKVTGTEDKAEEIINDMKSRIAKVQEKTANIKEKRSVIFEIDPEPYVAGKNTFMNEILDIINARNLITDEGWVKIDQEAYIEKNPDVILTTYGSYFEEAPAKMVASRPGWQDVKAVKEKQIYDVQNDLVTRPGPRLAKGVEEVAKLVYPEVFNE